MIRNFNFLLSYFLVSCFGLSLLANPAYANFPLPPRLSVLAYASDYAVGQADLMLPMQGNASHNLYVDPALSYGSDNQNEADIGLGYRWIANQTAILGGYLFGGYSRIDNNVRLWILNPGIETLGSRWDAHLNAYFSMGDRHTNAGNGVSAYFSGHSQFGSVFLVDQYVGNGADAKVGYQLFPGSSLKAYLGSYYFLPAQTNNIWGGAAGVEYWLTQHVKMVGSYTHDNLRHSTYAFGIGLEWGGTHVHRADPALEERLTDPVERYLAELGRGSTIPSGIKGQSTGSTVLLADNIAFFSQTGGPNNGGMGLTLAGYTFENPCGPTDFTQTGVTTLGGLLPNTQLYFNGGTYTSGGTVNLDPGQSVESHSANYSQPATGSARSTIMSNTIGLQGNNTLENIILLPLSFVPDGAGVSVTGANNVITGSQIGVPNNTFDLGVSDSGSNTLIDNNNIFAEGTVFFSEGTTTIQNSRLTLVNRFNVGFGVGAANSGEISINNSQIQLSGANTLTGLTVQNGSEINATNTTVTATNTAGGPSTALEIQDASSTIIVTGGALSVLSIGTAQITSGSPFTIQGGTACQVNGATVVCP